MNVSSLPMSNMALRSNEIALWAWGLMLMVLPFSTALALLFSALGVLFSALGLRRHLVVQTLRSPVVLLALALFAWLMLSALWSVAPREELIEGAWKYRKLLFVFLIAASIIACKKRPVFLINFFLIGCGVVALGSLMSRFGILELLLGPPPLSEGGWPIGGTIDKYWFRIGGPNNPTFGRNHISQGFFLTVAAGFSFVRVRWEGSGDKSFRNSIWWLATTLTFIMVVFQLQGRTGYFLSGTLIAFWALWGWRRLVGGTRVVFVSALLFVCALTIFLSPHVSDRIKQAKNGDQAVRVNFWKEGGRMWIESPIYGHGVGSYAELFGRNNHNEEWIRKSRAQPHSEVVILAVQGGIVAALLFITMLLLMIRYGYRQETPETVGYAITIFLAALNSIFNSILWDMSEGHFIVVMAAVFSGAFFLPKTRGSDCFPSSRSPMI